MRQGIVKNFLRSHFDKEGGIKDNGFKKGLAPEAWGPMITFESSTRQLGVRSGGAAHKKEAPRSIDGGDARRWHFSHQSQVTSHSRLLIPSH